MAHMTDDARRALIVAGMHRGGTSAVSRVLNLLALLLDNDTVERTLAR